MMPQEEASGSMHEQAGQTYGRYEGDKGQHDETSYEQLLREGPVGKVYPQPRDNKNILRLITFAIAMVTLMAFGVLCLVLVGGTAGWVSFCAASLAIFIVAVVAIDKIK
jgi:hypothetical protein